MATSSPSSERWATPRPHPTTPHVYDDAQFEKVTRQLESVAPYALAGAFIARDRAAIAWAQEEELWFAAGNLYVNDKPRAPWSASSGSAGAARRAPTTRPAPRSTCSADLAALD